MIMITFCSLRFHGSFDEIVFRSTLDQDQDTAKTWSYDIIDLYLIFNFFYLGIVHQSIPLPFFFSRLILEPSFVMLEHLWHTESLMENCLQ